MHVHEHMERLKDEQALSELSSQMVTVITTEHYNLQMGRAMTVTDTNGRSTLFISTVSGALIAITFPLAVCTGAGIAIFLMSFSILQRYQWKQWSRLEWNLAAILPGQSLQEKPEV